MVGKPRSILILDDKVTSCLRKLKSYYATLDGDFLFKPAGEDGRLHPSDEAAREVYERVASIMDETLGTRSEGLAAAAEAGGTGSLEPRRCLDDLLRTPDGPAVPDGMQGEAGGPLALFFAVYFARPFLKHRARRRPATPPGENALTGRCPSCASRPSLAFIVKEPEGQRQLWCHRCDERWSFGRTDCPFCGNDKQGTTGYLSIEGEGIWTIGTCEACRRYIKTYDERGEPGGILVDADQLLWSSVILDLAAQKHGYREPADGGPQA